MGHEGACANLHGHNYVVEVHAEADELDEVGRVVDFAVMKQVIGSWLDASWDHTTLLCKLDERFIGALDILEQPRFLLDGNPTAEYMAEYLLAMIWQPNPEPGTAFKVTKVVVWETENCRAEATL
jgi:6-pyruvoyltetrahydropterin/6-carboxytetrahydropterin synthase